MGRRIYAEKVGIDKNDTYVHKFWVAVQPSDVSDYLDTFDPHTAILSVDNENAIKAKVMELKDQFNKEYGLTYEQYMPDTTVSQERDPRELTASRLNLGEHLLLTIENMKDRGIEQQQLTIEL